MGRTRPRVHVVKPRLVWGGLAVAVVGMVVLALGVAGTSWWWSLAGTAVLVIGAAVAIRGGGLHDTHRPGLLGEEARAVVHAEARRTVRHGEVTGAPARAAREADQTRRSLLASTERISARPLAPMAAAVMVTTGILLLAAQSPLYPMSHTGQLGSLRALGAGVVFTLSGLRVLVGSPGRHLLASGLALLAGLALFAGGVLLAHQRPTPPVVEALGGAVGSVAALVCAVSPTAEGFGSGRSRGKR